ncbi:MAG: glycosyltransferase [Acidobacteria bacterium]|jgi:glycosyltransferase involved in cell wall biosynthesis|nr:glycosyltransferase [Acidobacteriota bacterium]
MEPGLLSVIAANYNNEQYIKDCLDSILSQTFQKLEIIVSDDCSTDSSPGIISDYVKKYPGKIKAIFNPTNRGVAQTRHEAILSANGEYITTLDSDDYYYDPQKLMKEIALITGYLSKNKDIIAFSNIVLVNGDKTMIGTWGKPGNIKEGSILEHILARSCMIPRDFIMKKEAYFTVGGYDARFPIYEDWDLKIRLASRFEFYYTGINGTAYRRHGTGLSASPFPQHIIWLKKIFKKNLNLAPKQEKKTITKGFNDFIKKQMKEFKKNKAN